MQNKMNVVGNIYCYGIYCMKEHGENGKVYYVGSGEINDCLSRHLFYLKRGLYEGTNKVILQDKYDMDSLDFTVLHESESKDNYKNFSKQQKEDLQKAMSVLEEFYINLYKDTVCNTQMSVTRHSSNKNSLSTIKRRHVNLDSNNPNAKHPEKIIAEILFLKLNGYKPSQIHEIYKDMGIDKNYIYQIGISKWIFLEPIKPTFIEEQEVDKLVKAN